MNSRELALSVLGGLLGLMGASWISACDTRRRGLAVAAVASLWVSAASLCGLGWVTGYNFLRGDVGRYLSPAAILVELPLILVTNW